MKRVLAVRGSRWKPEKSLPYDAALNAAGIDTVFISPNDSVPKGVSGLMLMGGSDVNPARYHEVRRAKAGFPDDARDNLECTLIQDFLYLDLPILAICRGVQILNVQHGGTLIQHLETSERHRVKTADLGMPVHKVELVARTRLAAIMGDPPALDVNSRHHQAVGLLGDLLVVSARDPEDGTIEAVERPDKRFIVGVQWHPEDQAAHDERQIKLFRAFAAAL